MWQEAFGLYYQPVRCDHMSEYIQNRMKLEILNEYIFAGVEKCSHPLKSQGSSVLCGERTEKKLILNWC